MKIQNKNGGGGRVGWEGVRVDVNGEVKLFENSKIFFFFLGGGGSGRGVRLRGGGVRVDVNGELKFL